uniref:Uncharacterized protein n=1 Tax=Rhipicephalus zambeziensis TaxID=60191 RepID=A0A224YF85_9ACAR
MKRKQKQMSGQIYVESCNLKCLYCTSAPPDILFPQRFHSNTNDILHVHGASYAVSMYYSYKLVTLKETFVPMFEKKKKLSQRRLCHWGQTLWLCSVTRSP